MQKRIKREWSSDEIRVLKAGKLPEGRTYHAVQQFCSRIGITFPGKKFRKQMEENKTVCSICGAKCYRNNRLKNRKFACDECFKRTIHKKIL